MGIPGQLTCFLRNLFVGEEATVRTGRGKQTGSKLGKEYIKPVYRHLAFLTYMLSIIMQNARLDEAQLESRLPKEILITSDRQMTPSLWQKAKRN